MNTGKELVCFLVEDDADDREIFVLAISNLKKNILCITAQDGVEALEIRRNDEAFIPDYIILDLKMPRINGKQCLAELRKIQRLSDVPIIMYSTSAAPGEVQEIQEIGASHFFTKPSSLSDFIKILELLLVDKERAAVPKERSKSF